MKKNEFIEMVTVVNGQTRETLAVSPLAVGDTLKLTKLMNLPKENTLSLKAAAEKLFDAVNSAAGLTLTIAKTYKSTSATGNVRNNYRFNAVQL